MNTVPQTVGRPAPLFNKVGENLYRHASSGIYYALLKRGGKQFRRSLKTTDRPLAARRLVELREKVSRLSQSSGASKITFGELADRWFETVKGNLKPAPPNEHQTTEANLR